MESKAQRALVVIEQAVADAWPELAGRAQRALLHHGLSCPPPCLIAGGEAVKNSFRAIEQIWAAIDAARIDRHAQVIVIGGGALLDAVGFAAATAHRGVRLIRFPTTTLAQDDSGVGVKCAINYFDKKNWLGSFAVPFAVVNDFDFLFSQSPASNRAGLIEAIKVAIVKDAGFFRWIEAHRDSLAALERDALETCVKRSALLHATHIATGGDPFEMGSSRPLDFGHWAAHKLESLTSYQLSHAEAVAIGLALDTVYAHESGHLAAADCDRILSVLHNLQMRVYHPAIELRGSHGRLLILDGLREFQEHLGGELTVLLPKAIGDCLNVHAIDAERVEHCIKVLHARSQQASMAVGN